MRNHRFATFWLLVALGSCAMTQLMAASDTPAAAPKSPGTPAPSFDRTRWSLVESRLAVKPPDDKDTVRLEFTADRLSANSGCNIGNAGYRIEAGVLVLTPMAATQRACIGPAADYEPAFFAFLDSRPTVRLDRDRA